MSSTIYSFSFYASFVWISAYSNLLLNALIFAYSFESSYFIGSVWVCFFLFNGLFIFDIDLD